MSNQRVASAVFLVAASTLMVMVAGCGPSRQSQLVVAAGQGNIDAVKAELAKGTDPNATGRMGRTALWAAADGGHQEIVSLLIAGGADPHDEVLHAAAEAGRVEVIEMLLEKGVNPNETDSGGETALFNAAWAAKKEAAGLLMQNGANVNYQSAVGRTALHYSAWDSWQIKEEDRLEMAQLLIKNGADVNITAENGHSPLHEASSRGYLKIVTLLVESGADVNKRYKGETALDRANRHIANDAASNYKASELADYLRTHGGKTGRELDASSN